MPIKGELGPCSPAFSALATIHARSSKNLHFDWPIDPPGGFIDSYCESFARKANLCFGETIEIIEQCARCVFQCFR